MKEGTANASAYFDEQGRLVDGHHRTAVAPVDPADVDPVKPPPTAHDPFTPRRRGKPFDMDAERYRLRLQGLHRADKAERNRAKRLRRAFRGEIIRLRAPSGLRTAGLFWRGGGHPTKADREAIQRFLKAWLLGDGAPQLAANARMPLDWRLERAARRHAKLAGRGVRARTARVYVDGKELGEAKNIEISEAP